LLLLPTFAHAQLLIGSGDLHIVGALSAQLTRPAPSP
jgi:hypothetical protein